VFLQTPNLSEIWLGKAEKKVSNRGTYLSIFWWGRIKHNTDWLPSYRQLPSAI